MNNTSDRQIPPCCNILALDGGGVRGLSSLLILRDLMRYVNITIQDETYAEVAYEEIQPHDVFNLVTGTSTGGLIAIMLGKLGMTLAESIQAYHNLSKSIFGKKHFRGRITHGLAPTKYSGRRLERETQGLIRSRGLEVNIPMVSEGNTDTIACAVICREHHHQSKYSPFKQNPVPICSLRCRQELACLVSEAARATSAAPTFFPVQKIRGRYFVDGGMEHNNPSHAIFYHYVQPDRVARSPRSSRSPGTASTIAHHGHLDFSTVRFVNLGTGTKPEHLPPRQRDRLAELVPGFIRMALFMKRTLTEFAVNSESVAEQMRSLASISSDSVKYERFSADNGVCYIKMDKYKDLDRIKDLTSEYLQIPTIQDRLRKLGEELARDYLQKHRLDTAGEPVPPTSLTVPDPNAPILITPTQMLLTPEPSASASASINSSAEDHPAQDRDLEISSTSPVPSRMGTGHFLVDARTERNGSAVESRMLST